MYSVDQIANMLRQGTSPNQIVQYLQSQGMAYPDAQNQVNQAMAYLNQMQSQQSGFPQQNSSSAGIRPEDMEKITKKIEEMSEAIIEEKWTEVASTIKKIEDWKKDMEDRYLELDTKFNELKSGFNSLQDSIVGKIGDYDDHIVKIGSNVKSLEKVFQKVIPFFIENVNELAKLVKKLKEQAPQEPINDGLLDEAE
jgi:prefoldin subunit 5